MMAIRLTNTLNSTNSVERSRSLSKCFISESKEQLKFEVIFEKDYVEEEEDEEKEENEEEENNNSSMDIELFEYEDGRYLLEFLRTGGQIYWPNWERQ